MFYGCISVIEAQGEDTSELPVLILDGAVHLCQRQRPDPAKGVSARFPTTSLPPEHPHAVAIALPPDIPKGWVYLRVAVVLVLGSLSAMLPDEEPANSSVAHGESADVCARVLKNILTS